MASRADTCVGGHTDEVNGMCFHPVDKSLVATASDDRTIILWDLERREPKEVLSGHRNSVYGLAFDHTAPTRCWHPQHSIGRP